MIKKINNKGMTLVEVVVCFALVTIVLVSMYSSISVYKTKQNIESYKETVITYKNLLTKEIQDDLIKKGLVYASASNSDEVYTVNMSFKDGSSKTLEITRRKAADAFEGGYTNSFIYYGDMNRNGVLEYEDNNPLIPGYDSGADYNEILRCFDSDPATPLCDENEKKIMGWIDSSRNTWSVADYTKICTDSEYLNGSNPDCLQTAGESIFLLNNGLVPKTHEIQALGAGSNDDTFKIKYGETEYPFPDLGSTLNDYNNKVYDLRINNVEISTENNILSIYIGFYHPELLTRYAIDIVCPINYS